MTSAQDIHNPFGSRALYRSMRKARMKPAFTLSQGGWSKHRFAMISGRHFSRPPKKAFTFSVFCIVSQIRIVERSV